MTSAMAEAPVLSEEDRSKDMYFRKIAELSEVMMAVHGKDFAIGTLILAVRFMAQGQPLIKRNSETTGESAVTSPAG